MNPEQSELLIRVDQNVINLVDLFNKHLEEDKEFQKTMWTELAPLKTDKSERNGARKFASLLYGIVGGAITLMGTHFFGK